MGQYYKPVILAANKKTVLKWMYSHSFGNGLKLMEHSWIGNGFVSTFQTLIKDNPQRVCWAGDYADNCKDRESNLYHRCKESLEVKPTETTEEIRYVINHSKKQFVDTTKCPVSDTWTDPATGKVYTYKVHPLPLLTCEGNGRGGGDFHGSNKYVGTWARDLISVSDTKPSDYEEIVPKFKE